MPLTSTSEIVITVSKLIKNFNVATQDVSVLKDLTFEIHKKDFLVIFGPSGCGKSTLLHILLGLEVPTSGVVTFFGTDLYKDTNDDVRGEFRKTHIGMIYQQPNWIKSMTVVENTAFPLLLLGWKRLDSLFKARQMLELVSMEKWADYFPTELSSGQQQRIALARGMVNDPDVVVADEPTGNLDFEAGQEMMSLLLKLNTEHKKTIIMVTHDLDYLTFSSRAVRMKDGKIMGVYDKKMMPKLFSELHSKRQTSGQIES